jgi:hypothetical protein
VYAEPRPSWLRYPAERPLPWYRPEPEPPDREDPTTYRPAPSMWAEMRDAVVSWDAVVFVGLVVVILALSVVGWEPG